MTHVKEIMFNNKDSGDILKPSDEDRYDNEDGSNPPSKPYSQTQQCNATIMAGIKTLHDVRTVMNL
jgi:hypothetical protein